MTINDFPNVDVIYVNYYLPQDGISLSGLKIFKREVGFPKKIKKHYTFDDYFFDGKQYKITSFDGDSIGRWTSSIDGKALFIDLYRGKDKFI